MEAKDKQEARVRRHARVRKKVQGERGHSYRLRIRGEREVKPTTPAGADLPRRSRGRYGASTSGAEFAGSLSSRRAPVPTTSTN